MGSPSPPLLLALWFSATCLLCLRAEAFFGWNAHEISATVAEAYISQKAFDRVLQITGNETLVDVCTWADDVRYSTHPWSSTLHYVNPKHDPLRNQCSYDDARDCVNDFCVTSAVYNFSSQLIGGYGNQGDAVRFLTHFVADMHQPLHVCGIYLGGNDYDIKFYGSDTNLHAIWDTGIPQRFMDTEMGGKGNYIDYLLDKLAGEWKGEIADWVKCSTATTICPDEWAEGIEPINCSHCWQNLEENLGDEYYDANKEIINKLMAMAGVRLAYVFNEIFA